MASVLNRLYWLFLIADQVVHALMIAALSSEQNLLDI